MQTIEQATRTKTCPFCAEEIKYEAIVCRYCGKELNTAPSAESKTKPTKKGSGKGIGWIWIAALILAVGLFGKHDTTSTPASAPAKKLTPSERKAADIDAHPVRITTHHWRRGGFDTVALWDVTFHNQSDHPVGNINYRTGYSSETGNEVTSHTGELQKIIPAHHWRTIEINDGFIDKEAVKAGIEITDFEYLDKHPKPDQNGL